MSIQDSIVLISSQDKSNKRFGSGFIIRQSANLTHVVTCAHVVDDVGDREKILVDGRSALVISMGEADGLDLAVLQVAGFWDKSPLNLGFSGQSGDSIVTVGFQEFDGRYLSRTLNGVLENQVTMQSRQGKQRVLAWDLKITDDYLLKPGYSGSPVISCKDDFVIGVVSHRHNKGERGLAIDIESLANIWQMIDSNEVYRLLLKLGYRQQVQQFRKLVKSHSIAALLIYGEPEYGQKWLLNRLVSQHLPDSLTGKVIKIDLIRQGRRNDTDSIWRGLARRVGLKRTTSVDQIIQRMFAWWETQDVLLVFHDVDHLPKAAFTELIESFWLPLSAKAEEYRLKRENSYKLLMFLIDYSGNTANWHSALIEQMDTTWKSKMPVGAPRLEEFSDQDLIDWLDYKIDELPQNFSDEETLIDEILKNSDEGIPELALQEICERFGVDWYQEIEKWLTL